MSAYDLDVHTISKVIPLNSPFTLEGWLCGLCSQGSIDYQFNQEHRHIVPNTLFFIPTNQMLTFVEISDDVHIALIHIPSKVMEQLHEYTNTLPQMGKSFQDGLYISMDHVDNLLMQGLSLPQEICDEERQLFAVMKKYLCPQVAQSNMNVAAPILQSMLMLMKSCKNKSQTYRTLTRQEQLTKDFFTLLMKHHIEHHEVSFYASEQCISPKYLSNIVKLSTGHPAQEWINRAIVLTAKRMLKNENLTVSQVSDRLHFSCSSSFVRFFHTHAGETPRGFLYKNVNCEL